MFITGEFAKGVYKCFSGKCVIFIYFEHLLFVMNITEFQQEVLRVFSEMDKMPNRIEHTKQSACIHLMEEMGEIARQVTSEVHRPEKFDKKNLGTEFADTLMFIVFLAKFYDIDLSKEMKNAISRVEQKVSEMSSN